MASTGSQLFQGSHGVIDLNFVYTLSLLVTVYTLVTISFNCLYRHFSYLFILGGDLNHTSVPGAVSAWMAGTLLQSGYGGAFWRASWKRISSQKGVSVAGWYSQSPQP